MVKFGHVEGPYICVISLSLKVGGREGGCGQAACGVWRQLCGLCREERDLGRAHLSGGTPAP